MDENDQHQAYANLTNVLEPIWKLEPITQKNIYDFCKQSKFEASSTITLMSIIYNLNITSKQLSQIHNIQKKIYYKGYIIGQYAKSINLPKPANYLVQFDHGQFDYFCQLKNLPQLNRQCKGLYPPFYIQQHMPFHFVPIFEHINNYQFEENSQFSGYVGNRTWKCSRQVIKAFYTNKLKKQELKSWQNQWHSLKNGIKLCYIILLGLTQQMDQYIELVNRKMIKCRTQINGRQCQFNDIQYRQLANSLKIWYNNYQQYINEGIDIYSDKNITDVQIFKQNHPDSLTYRRFHCRIIQLIIHLIKNKRNSSNTLEILLEECKKVQNNWNYSINDRLIILSMCQAIRYKLTQVRTQESQFRNYYMEIKQTAYQQFFDRIFLSQSEILKKYQNGQSKTIPIMKYNDKIMAQIYKSCFQNNHIQYLSNDELMDKHFKKLDTGILMQILVNSQLMGSKDQIQNNQKQSKLSETYYGQKILQILTQSQMSQKLNDPKMKERYGRYIHDDLRRFETLWRRYYQQLKNDRLHCNDKKIMQSFCKIIQESVQAEKRSQQQINQQIQEKKYNLDEFIKNQPQNIAGRQQFVTQIENSERQKSLRLNIQYPSSSKQALNNILSFIIGVLDKQFNNFRAKSLTNMEHLKPCYQLLNYQALNQVLSRQDLVKKHYKQNYSSILMQMLLLNSQMVNEFMDDDSHNDNSEMMMNESQERAPSHMQIQEQNNNNQSIEQIVID